MAGKKALVLQLFLIDPNESGRPGLAGIRRRFPLLLYLPVWQRRPGDAVDDRTLRAFAFSAQDHGTVIQVPTQMQDGTVPTHPILVPLFLSGVIVVNAHAAFPRGGSPLLADGAAFGLPAHFARADLFALWVDDLPFADPEIELSKLRGNTGRRR